MSSSSLNVNNCIIVTKKTLEEFIETGLELEKLCMNGGIL